MDTLSYKIGICDDEILQVKVNGLYLKDIADRNSIPVEVVGFTSPDQLLLYLRRNELDILFLDIDMGNKSGIQTAVELFKTKPNLIIIFITGHREFAGEAFDVEALGYILKPVDVSKLERIFKKAILQISAVQTTNKVEPTLIITQEKTKVKIIQKDIVCVRRVLAKTVIETMESEYVTYETISAIQQRLEPYFLRINQSELININDIDYIRGTSIFTKNGEEKIIGRSYKKEVLNLYFSQ